MGTKRTTAYVLMMLAISSLFVSGCRKKCFPSDGDPLTSLTKQQLRITDSTDTSLEIDEFNAPIILTMGDGFDVQVNVLENNRYFDTPAFAGTYRIDSDGRSGTVEFTFTEGTQLPQGSPPRVLTWNYKLSSRNVVFDDQGSGDSHLFIKYTGIRSPDQGACDLDTL